MGVRTVLYAEGMPGTSAFPVIVVNESFGGYQIIAGEIHTQWHIMHNEFFPRDKFTLITSSTRMSHGMQPILINHDTLETHAFTMEEESYGVQYEDMWAKQSDNPEDATVIPYAQSADEFGTSYSIRDKITSTVKIANQGSTRVKEDELKRALKAGSFRLVTNSLLYSPDSGIALIADDADVTALRIPKGWKPFATDAPNHIIHVVRDNVPYGTIDVNPKDVGVLDFSSSKVKTGSHTVPIPSEGIVAYRDENGKVTTSAGGEIPKAILDKGFRYLAKTNLSNTALALTQQDGLHAFDPVAGTTAKWKLPKGSIQTIAVAMSELQPLQGFSVFNYTAAITYGLNHYAVGESGYQPLFKKLKSELVLRELIDLLKRDTFGASPMRIYTKLNEVCHL